MEPIANWFSELKVAQQPEEIILSLKGMQIPKTWREKTTWAQDIETAITQDPLPDYINIGWEETGNQLLLRFIQKTVDLQYLNNDSWKEMNREAKSLLMSN